jgi:hypothetical protein
MTYVHMALGLRHNACGMLQFIPPSEARVRTSFVILSHTIQPACQPSKNLEPLLTTLGEKRIVDMIARFIQLFIVIVLIIVKTLRSFLFLSFTFLPLFLFLRWIIFKFVPGSFLSLSNSSFIGLNGL